METHKSPQIAKLIADCQGHPHYDAHYLGYFKCFNQQLYYEAHDVLEELWLDDRQGPHGNFYKGMIQFTGAFVHLQKGRLRPARNLFLLALENFAQYPDQHEGFDLSKARGMAERHISELEATHFGNNPWSPDTAAQLGVPK